MCMLKDSAFQGRKLALAVVAIQIAAVVFLMVDFVMHASAFWTNISVLVLGFNDEINGIVLGRKSLEKFNMVHTPCFCLRCKGTKSLSVIMIFASSRNPLQD